MKHMQQTGPSPAHNDEELDEEQGMWGAAVVLSDAWEVHRTVPQLGAEEHQDLPGEQGHLRAALLQPGRRERRTLRDVGRERRQQQQRGKGHCKRGCVYTKHKHVIGISTEGQS